MEKISKAIVFFANCELKLHFAKINSQNAINLTNEKQQKNKSMFLKYKKDGTRYAITRYQ
ncbi:hypothetical protein [Moritella sp. 28]|uniref:hypothetical protein n=1 Tax=Moritella sp. 28 TaxID=2746232 RepID=UPI001BA6EA4F|nr:hypothetical protein [Moritella sp. 28]QUM84064.1 hypothetical protein HWV02_05750 [Moritella sp. 28]